MEGSDEEFDSFLIEETPQSSPQSLWKKLKRKVWCPIAIGLVSFAAVILLVIIVVFISYSNHGPEFSSVESHLQQLQTIADSNKGSRSSEGFLASIEYVLEILKSKTDLLIEVQTFDYMNYQQIEPPELGTIVNETFVSFDQKQFNAVSYSGNGELISNISVILNLGCDKSDFQDAIPTNQIALIKRGNCTFAEKAQNAVQFGYQGVIIYNNAQGAFSGTLGSSSSLNIPVIGVSDSLGETLVLTTSDIKMKNNGKRFLASSKNIIAKTPHGSEASAIVIGTHLDSVSTAPGINDNGSGSAVNLAIATAFSSAKTSNQIIFAWWGAEENGLVGSEYYANQLVEQGIIKNIALNLNFDMIGSPNGIRGVYDGNTADTMKKESTVISQLFSQHFQKKRLPSKLLPLGSRSDHASFMKRGIPVGGLFAGGDETKTMEERDIYGGLANAPYDPCYHQPCDSFANIDLKLLEEMSGAIWDVLDKLSKTPNLREFLSTN